ncbi:MAG TPA: hypothetical protein VND91_12165 [Candidatus Saccharimonadia bacterium]|nr:hypothetical protein [Candidatus Saccharimonadia bacterium]
MSVSLFRLYFLRATYLLVAVGLALTIWPLLLEPPGRVEHFLGVVRAFLSAMGLLALLGIRYPLQMLPLLLLELAWKVVWVFVYGLPQSSTGELDGPERETLVACLMGVIVLVAIPWRYVFEQYVRRPGDRWRRD